MEQPVRKQVRLPAYDYSSPGAYFFTICTQGRRCVFSEINRRGDPCGRPALKYTPYGTIAAHAFDAIESIYGISVDNFVVMPNHVRFLCQIADLRATARVAPTLGRIVGAYKSIVANECRTAGFEEKLWQRNYHEHVIRCEVDYREIWNYIDGNPSKWTEDRYYQEP